jgi:hypothetical protein
MSTRGALGVLVDGKTKVMYNHSDSYPTELGVAVAESIEAFKGDVAKMRELGKALRLVDEDDLPSVEDKRRFVGACDTSVGERSENSWYCLLRSLQGNLKGLLEAGVMIDARTFLAASLFCEWAYVVNLDDEVLEVYKGYQKKPHAKGRYAKDPVEPNNIGSIYYPVALVATFPLSKLPTPEKWAKIERKK